MFYLKLVLPMIKKTKQCYFLISEMIFDLIDNIKINVLAT